MFGCHLGNANTNIASFDSKGEENWPQVLGWLCCSSYCQQALPAGSSRKLAASRLFVGNQENTLEHCKKIQQHIVRFNCLKIIDLEHMIRINETLTYLNHISNLTQHKTQSRKQRQNETIQTEESEHAQHPLDRQPTHLLSAPVCLYSTKNR